MLMKRHLLVAPTLVGLALMFALPALGAFDGSGPAPTPTVDRLAAPPTITNPNQADIGEQLFWQHCQPCHGDKAQGLTADWRAQYPADHQDCWKSRCHGDPPYQNGFILPRVVPALVGPGTLNHFATAADLYYFVSHAMPFQAPGSLKPEEYWAIVAFLLRGHGLLPITLPISDAASAQRIPIGATSPPPATTTNLGGLGGEPASIALLLMGGLAVLGVSWRIWRRPKHHG
jgi:cytochrome c5